MNKFIKPVLTGIIVAVTLNLLFPPNHISKARKNISFKFGQMSDLKPNMYNSVIRLRMSEGSCSGWIIDKHYAITAGHCITDDDYNLDENSIKIFADNGQDTKILAMAVEADETMDFGLIQGDFSNFTSLKTNFSDNKFFLDDNVYFTCGFPLGQNKLVCHPFISVNPDIFAVKGIGHLIPGMSGGPVINSQGEAVGINTAMSGSAAIIVPLEGFLGDMGLE